MRINVGSKNEVKINAVKELLADYPMFAAVEVLGAEAPSEVSDQPKSLDETIRGAKNRARNAYQNCDYGVGIEGGFMEVPHTKTGYLEFQACAIYDGKNFSIGLSSAYECPPQVMRLIHDGLDLNDAAYQTGLTSNTKIGVSGGFISVLTKNRLVRIEFTKEAVRMALIHLENPELY